MTNLDNTCVLKCNHDNDTKVNQQASHTTTHRDWILWWRDKNFRNEMNSINVSFFGLIGSSNVLDVIASGIEYSIHEISNVHAFSINWGIRDDLEWHGALQWMKFQSFHRLDHMAEWKYNMRIFHFNSVQHLPNCFRSGQIFWQIWSTLCIWFFKIYQSM